MPQSPEPLVSVVTPVYNGEATIAECIASVLNQRYTNFEYVIVNNCSTDRTSAILESFASRDPRIRIHSNTEFLTALQNQNFAMRLVSPESRYCKVVHADDWLFPECISQMVELAETDPSIGIVGSFMLHGPFVYCDGLPPPVGGEGNQYPTAVFPGREICRIDLHRTGRPSVLGNPTTILLRSSLILEREEPFYDERHLFMDRDVCFRILQEHNFGFVYQVLSFMRRHEGQLHSFMHRVHTFKASQLYLLVTYGPSCLDRDEYEALLREKLSTYRAFLKRNSLRRIPFRKHKEFWDYHLRYLQLAGYPVTKTRLVWYATSELLDIILNPKQALEMLWRKLRRQRNTAIRKH